MGIGTWMAAATVHEYVESRSIESGGGDGLGTLILPRRQERPLGAVLSGRR